jgi:hypothetical protein
VDSALNNISDNPIGPGFACFWCARLVRLAPFVGFTRQGWFGAEFLGGLAVVIALEGGVGRAEVDWSQLRLSFACVGIQLWLVLCFELRRRKLRMNKRMGLGGGGLAMYDSWVEE